MKKNEKARIMNKCTSEINRAKDEMYRASQKLAADGLERDSETLYRMILKLEEFQTKYDDFRF